MTIAVGALGVLTACTKESKDSETRARATASSASFAGSGRARFGCDTLLPEAKWQPQGPETLKLQPPDASEKTIVLSKTGVIVTFSRREFLTTARCLNLNKAVHYIETETGFEKESPLRDAFQLSYVAAALLDLGRVGVKLKKEKEPRRTIVRDAWSAEGCAGQCRSRGRVYRLEASDPLFFFRVTDKTETLAK